jgi:hypothetical protein
LIHFTGNSGDIRLVLSKPDRVGMWFHQLVIALSNDTMHNSFLLHMKLHHANVLLKTSIPTRMFNPEFYTLTKIFSNITLIKVILSKISLYYLVDA